VAINASWTKEQLKLYTLRLELFVNRYCRHAEHCKAATEPALCACGFLNAVRDLRDLEAGVTRPADDAPALGSVFSK